LSDPDHEQPVGVVVVGTGYLGRLHARVLTEMPEVVVLGFVEPNDEIAAEVTHSLGLTRVGSVAELGDSVQAAVVATPTIHHFAVAEELLERGIDVMIEKPITAAPADARRLMETATRRGRIIQVGHVERYNPAIVAVAPYLDQPRFLEAERLGVWVGRSLDIDVLLDLMIHDLNLVLSLLGREVTEVRAVGVPVLTSKVDIANVRLQLAGGAVANLTASRVSSDRVRKIRFFGSDSYISVDTREQEVKGYRLVSSGAERTIQPLDVAVEKKEPLRAELESFVSCVRTRQRPLVSAEDGLAALELALRVGEAIDESLASWRAPESRA
jgi:predicted dehydrogenase